VSVGIRNKTILLFDYSLDAATLIVAGCQRFFTPFWRMDKHILCSPPSPPLINIR
jgi:hypothetical protein